MMLVACRMYVYMLGGGRADPDYISHGLAHDLAADDCTHDSTDRGKGGA